jgi:hypothetical protein
MISSYSSFSDATDNSAFCNKKTATKFSADYCFCENCNETKDYPVHIYIRGYLTCTECGFLRDECECLSFLYTEDFMAELGYNMPSIPHDDGWTGSLGVSSCEPRSAFDKAFYDSFGVYFSPAAATAAAAIENAAAAKAAVIEAAEDVAQIAAQDAYETYVARHGDATDEAIDAAFDASYRAYDLAYECYMVYANYCAEPGPTPVFTVADSPKLAAEDTEDSEDSEDDDENMDDLPHEILSPLQALHQFMRNSGVRYAWYLFGRSWFCRSQSLQELTVKVILSGKAAEINVAAGDFDEHLEELLCK